MEFRDDMTVDEAVENYLQTLATVRGFEYNLLYDVAKSEIGNAVLRERQLPLAPTDEHRAKWPPQETIPKKSWERQIPRGLRLMILERDRRQCQDCLSEEDLTIDHIRARSRGGTDDPSNLQVLCRPCNARKGVS